MSTHEIAQPHIKKREGDSSPTTNLHTGDGEKTPLSRILPEHYKKSHQLKHQNQVLLKNVEENKI